MASGEPREQSGPRHGKGCWMWPSGAAGLGSGTNRFLMRDTTHHAEGNNLQILPLESRKFIPHSDLIPDHVGKIFARYVRIDRYRLWCLQND